MYVFDKSDNDKWVREEAVVDNGAVECVTSVTVNWRTHLGTMKRGVFKVGPVSRTLISVDRLQETSHDVILTKNM